MIGKGGQAEASLSFQPGEAGTRPSSGRERQRNPKVFLSQQFLRRMHGAREGSWEGKGAGKCFWQPGTVDFHAEGNPIGSHAKPEGHPGLWGHGGTCQHCWKGHGGHTGQGVLRAAHALNFER